MSSARRQARSNARAARHRREVYGESVRFYSPSGGRDFYHSSSTGRSTWEPMAGEVVRDATILEQNLFLEIEARAYAAGWVYRTYGIVNCGYWYHEGLGKVSLVAPCA